MGARTLGVVLALALLAAGCSAGPGQDGGAGTPPSSVATGPADDDAFYRAPPPPAGAKAGDVIWARSVPAPPGSRGWIMLYWSADPAGRLVAVSGVTFEPTRPPDSPRAILAWGHGTFGLGDQCAASRGFIGGSGPSVPLVQAAVQNDLAFVATDFRGLGTPDPHQYLVNQTAGRDVLDSIRAAATLTGAGPTPRALVMGQSQGGGAALFAAELQPTYAPDVQLLGAVGVSVPSDLGKLDGQLSGGNYVGYVLMTIYGYRAAYPSLAADDPLLTPAGRLALQKIAGQCTNDILGEFSGRKESEFGAAEALHAPDFSARLTENEPGRIPTSVPILLVHGGADDTIPVQDSADLLAAFCSVGATVSRTVYPDSGHVDVLDTALPDIVPWLSNRLAGTPTAARCAG
jgi:fermentation-respiration switch protein FrsA (DUF1100 family)